MNRIFSCKKNDNFPLVKTVDNVYRFKEQIQKQRNPTFLQGFQIEIKLQEKIVKCISPWGRLQAKVINVRVPSNPT